MTIAWILIILGAMGLFVSFNVTYNPLYTEQISMNTLWGSKTQEHSSGYSWKWFWYKIQGKPIDMRSSIIITSGGILMMDWDKFTNEKVYEKITPRIYETKDSVVQGSWATAIRPLKGNLPNFLLKTPQVGALMVMAKIDLTISDNLASRPTEEVLGDKKNISQLVSQIFGGEEVISPYEKSYGILVSDPQLFDLNLGKRSQEAAEKLFESKKFREAMEDMATQIEDPDKRTNAILIANGMIKKNVYDIEGLSSAAGSIANAFASIFTKKQ